MANNAQSKASGKDNVKAVSTAETKVRSAVDKWYSDNLANSVVSRDTDVHNLIHNAKPALVRAILAAVGQTQTQE